MIPTLAVLAPNYDPTAPFPKLDQVITIGAQLIEHLPLVCKVLVIAIYFGLMISYWQDGHKSQALMHGMLAVIAGVLLVSSAFAH